MKQQGHGAVKVQLPDGSEHRFATEIEALAFIRGCNAGVNAARGSLARARIRGENRLAGLFDDEGNDEQ